jgi:hypothetical protein
MRTNALSHWVDEAGLTRDEFSKRLGISLHHLDHLCAGTRRPDLDLAVVIEDATQGAVLARSWARPPKPRKRMGQRRRPAKTRARRP